MKGISTNPKVLLCTACRRFPSDYPDIIKIISVYRFPRASAPCRISPALRFIKQNVPEVEILEYPMWHEYVAKLAEGWDVVGFSFFQHQIGEIRQMIQEARRQGVREIWAGGYGALDYKVPGMVDRVFIGPGEDQVAQVFGYRVRDAEIQHPAMLVHFSLIAGIRYMTFGMLYTTHGCPFKCTFCQTPVFEKRRFTINFESIERVLEYYYKKGVKYITVMNETFGLSPEFTDKLTQLLARYKFGWWAQSRPDIILRNLDAWYGHGLRFVSIGVESLNQSSLDEVNKGQTVEKILEYAHRTRGKPGMYRIAAYMLGYENMNVEKTIQDAIRLKRLGFDAHTTSVLTPYPRTPLWDKLDSKYGIFDCDYNHFNSRYLVWHHPHISATQMHYLLRSVKGFLGRPFEVYRKGLKRLIWEELHNEGGKFLWRSLIKGPLASLGINDRKQVFFPKLTSST